MFCGHRHEDSAVLVLAEIRIYNLCICMDMWDSVMADSHPRKVQHLSVWLDNTARPFVAQRPASSVALQAADGAVDLHSFALNRRS